MGGSHTFFVGDGCVGLGRRGVTSGGGGGGGKVGEEGREEKRGFVDSFFFGVLFLLQGVYEWVRVREV